MPTLFLVEDNAADVELFRMALQEAGVDCELVVFEDGRAIIDRIREYEAAPARPTPDLIVLDLNLPKNDGTEVLQFVGGEPRFANVPFIVLSSSTSLRERDKLSAFHILEYVVKPADLEEYLKIGEIVRNTLQTAIEMPG